MAGRSVVKVVGPLASYASGFDQELGSRGYTRLSADGQLRLMAHVSRDGPRIFRTAELTSFHAACCRFRYSVRTSWGVR
jgi:hypothetical protein